MDKNLISEDGTVLKWLKKDYNLYLNKTTLIYGRTQSGKSTIIDEIMYLCKDYIPAVFIICQSSVTVSSSPYHNKIPNNCIKNGVSKEWLESFIERQKGRAALYKTANEIKVLKGLFDKIKQALAISNEIREEEEIVSKSQDYINKINMNNKLDFVKKREHIANVQELKNQYLKDLYRKTIRENKNFLERKPGLSKDEECCINYLDFNPNILLVFDDCASAFKKWVKESKSVSEMFYNGRHYFITQIISSQDDTEINAELRKNALVSIFTTSQAATANFNRSSNAYSKAERKEADTCIKIVFDSGANTVARNFKKLVYIQNDPNPFFYTIADLYDTFRLGCDSLWELDDKIKAKLGDSGNGTNNAFFNNYHKI